MILGFRADDWFYVFRCGSHLREETQGSFGMVRVVAYYAVSCCFAGGFFKMSFFEENRKACRVARLQINTILSIYPIKIKIIKICADFIPLEITPLAPTQFSISVMMCVVYKFHWINLI